MLDDPVPRDNSSNSAGTSRTSLEHAARRREVAAGVSRLGTTAQRMPALTADCRPRSLSSIDQAVGGRDAEPRGGHEIGLRVGLEAREVRAGQHELEEAPRAGARVLDLEVRAAASS